MNGCCWASNYWTDNVCTCLYKILSIYKWIYLLNSIYLLVFFFKFFHNLNDTVSVLRSPRIKWSPASGNIDFTVDFNEVITSDRAKMFGIKIRKCRFDTEITSNRSYPLGLYTENLCLIECSIDAAIKICGCRPFFYKFGENFFSFFLIPHYCKSYNIIILRCWINLQRNWNVIHFLNY